MNAHRLWATMMVVAVALLGGCTLHQVRPRYWNSQPIPFVEVARRLVSSGAMPGGTVDVKLDVHAPMLLVTTTRETQCAYDVMVTRRSGRITDERAIKRILRACTLT